MNILVTGAKGFVGKNLIAALRNKGLNNIFEFTRDSEPSLLEKYTKECHFVFHLAGINRPKHESEFMEGNYGFTSKLLELLIKNGNNAPVLMSSSIHAERDNLYGRSKKAAEELLFNYQQKTNGKVYIYRLPNLFGKWNKPHYNSVVATFCHNIARDLDIQVDHSNLELNLCYIDDVLEEFIKALEDNPTKKGEYCTVPTTYTIKVGELARLIKGFQKSRENLIVANMEDTFIKKLYSTYLSYLPKDKFSYDLLMRQDQRGSFTEFIKTPDRGQVSVNISKPGITKGNHWHHTKSEKFLVVSGEGLIRFRKLDSEEIIEYKVSGGKLEVVDIPTGYTHSIVNIGDQDLVTVMWVNECFDPANPDTYYMEV